MWNSTAEYLFILSENIGRVVTHQYLHDRVRGKWGPVLENDEKRWSSVQKHWAKKALEKVGAPAVIEAIPGNGYRLVLGETDPEAEFIARCFRHRNAIEDMLAQQARPRRAA